MSDGGNGGNNGRGDSHRYDVGFGEMDREHRFEMGLIESVERALESGFDGPAAHAELQKLVGFTHAHLQSERLLMKLNRYPAADDHIREHDLLFEALKAVCTGHENGDSEAALAAIRTFRESLERHMERSDTLLGVYLQDLGTDIR